ncbi:beta-galactosidase [Streptomyces hainanensis]|nr:beta-galactosidase [Streptomyces hainanensis]
MPAAPHLMSGFRDRLPGIVFGGDYNPEQWSPDVWREDVRLMREAGVTLVSLGVFAWSALEPSDGTFTFGWLDEVMDLLGENGIAVNLATPNAAPPPWLAHDHPDSLPVERDGTRIAVGGRGHFCPSSPEYRDRALRIARRLAERYADHRALAMWHVGNEYGYECCCDRCDGLFRGWLQERYGSLEELNNRWGTLFWSQRYGDWSQVHLPRPVRGRTNPAREVDFKRFGSELLLGLVTDERDLLRSITPDIPVTTNFLQFHPSLDYRRWARELDVVAYDSYPDPARPHTVSDASFQYDLMRGIGGGRPWMLMEQAAAGVSQWPLNLVKRPGRMRLWSYQAIAHGADAVMFFQWRASRYGQEKFHSAMLPHSGQRARSWQEVRDLGNELPKMRPVAGTTGAARVAVVWDWENWWAVEGCYHPRNDFSYREVVTRQYRALRDLRLGVDVVSPDEDLAGYRLLVVPNQYLITAAQRDALRAHVEAGGHVVISYFSGIVDEHDRVHPDGYPGGLRDIIGGQVLDMSPLADDDRVGVRGLGDTGPGASGPGATGEWSATATDWQDDLVAESAVPLATYTSGFLAGRPAILDHRLGGGRVVYLGTRLDDDSFAHLLRTVADQAGVSAVHPAPAGVEVAERLSDDRRYLFLLNHTEGPVMIQLERAGHDLLTGREHAEGESLTLPVAGVAVLSSPR